LAGQGGFRQAHRLVSGELNPVIRHRIPDCVNFSANVRANPGQPKDTFCQRFIPASTRSPGWISSRDVDSREFPKAFPEPSCPALNDQQPARPNHQGARFYGIEGRRTRARHGEPILNPEISRTAFARNRAEQASGRRRTADQSPELHESLVEETGTRGRHETLGCLPKASLSRGRPKISLPGEPTRQHSLSIRLDDRGGSVERERQDRARDVAPHSRQRAERSRIIRDNPAMLADDCAGRLVEVFCSSVVAQALPEFENLALFGRSDRFDRREPS
jgi:hypothetical protein